MEEPQTLNMFWNVQERSSSGTRSATKMISPSWMSAIEISTLVELVALAAAECTTVHMALHMACFKAALLKRVLLDQHFFCNLIGS